MFGRIRGLEQDNSNKGRLRVLLVHVDVQDCKDAVRELTQTALLGKMTLVLTWSLHEAARYLETFKAYENKGPEMIQQRLSHSPKERAIELLSSIKSINKSDAANLLRSFGTLARVMQAPVEELMLVPGMGGTKSQDLYNVFHQPLKQPKEGSQG